MADSHGQKTGAHTEAEGGQHSGVFPPFDSSTFPSQLVSLVVLFVALYIIVSRVALPRVGAVIDARQSKIEGDLAEAEKTIAATRAAAMANVRGIAADAAGAIVQRLTGTAPDGNAVNLAVDASLKG